MPLRIAVTFLVIFIIFYIILGLYERYVKKINIDNIERVLIVALATCVWPITIIGAIIFIVVKTVDFLKKI